jgi:hypothetical protein
MARQEVQEQAAAAEPAPASSSRWRNLTIGGVLLGVMLVEGAGVFILAKHFTRPATATAATTGLEGGEEGRSLREAEVEVVRLRAQNEKSQQLYVYDLIVAASVSEKNAAAVEEILQRRQATIQDRFSRVVRSLDPQRFTEPDLATLRQQFRYELSRIVGETQEGETIREVLIPSLVRYSEN